MSLKEKDIQTVDIESVAAEEKYVEATQFADFNDKLDVEKYGATKRGLSSRHVSLLIIGQSIGTGLFIGLGKQLNQAGSLSLFLGFVYWACFSVWPLMQAVGEMCSYLPIKGTFLHYCARWIDPALGFACTIVYLYTSMMFVCVELVGFSGVISFWNDLNPGIWVAVGLVSYLIFNIFGVRWYGEIEFVTSLMKALLIIGLMFFSLISMCGGNPKHNAYGFQHWKEGGLFRNFIAEGSTGNFLAWFQVLVYAAFSCGGPDLLAMISGEIQNPRKNIGLAAKKSYIRIYVFTLGGVFFMNCLCSAVNPSLVSALADEAGSSGVLASPWVIGIKDVGVHGLDSLVNALVMSSAWSCGNAFFYGATRCAYSASLAGYLPRFFSKCLKNGCPIYCVLGTLLVACLSFLCVNNSSMTVFYWFINLATSGIVCAFVCLWLCYFKFRKALIVNGIDIKSSQYEGWKAPKVVHPFLSYLGITNCCVVLLFNGFYVFVNGRFNVADLFTCYFAQVFFLVLYVFWKILKKTHIRSDDEADIFTGKDEIDAEENMYLEEERNKPVRNGFVFKCGRVLMDFFFN